VAQQAEDRFLLEPSCAWRPTGAGAPSSGVDDASVVPFSVFGVFDGHGGKDAAEECVRGMLPALTAALVRCGGGARARGRCCGRAPLARRRP
jgi:serine/threonine protein phosphatase PrpC